MELDPQVLGKTETARRNKMRLNEKFDLIAAKQGNKEKINMYDLAVWLGRYNRENNAHLQPSQLNEEHIKQYLDYLSPLELI